MFCIVGFTCAVAYVTQRNLGSTPRKSLIEEIFSKDDLHLAGGQFIHRTARTDVNRHNKESFWENPDKPDNYWIDPMTERSLNAPSKSAQIRGDY